MNCRGLSRGRGEIKSAGTDLNAAGAAEVHGDADHESEAGQPGEKAVGGNEVESAVQDL